MPITVQSSVNVRRWDQLSPGDVAIMFVDGQAWEKMPTTSVNGKPANARMLAGGTFYDFTGELLCLPVKATLLIEPPPQA